MATSSIFDNIKITTPMEAEAFIKALEESEKAQANRKRTTPIIPVITDTEEIRKLMAKRFTLK